MVFYRDKIFDLDIFQTTGSDQVVSQVPVKSVKLYLVLINWSRTNPIPSAVKDEIDLVHCDWDINFL